MDEAYAVIGAGYGDEGKGLMVDYLVHRLLQEQKDPIVVRTNGGCQAAHTVQLPSGERYVFKHHGSGSLQRVPTFLSQDFVVNPIVFRREDEDLRKLTDKLLIPSPKVSVSERAIVSLPMDMIINQAAEIQRGGGRHGSCGYGINEAVTRSQESLFRVDTSDLATLELRKLRWIRDTYMPRRLEQLGLEIPEQLREAAYSDEVLKEFLRDVSYFYDNVYVEEENHPRAEGHDCMVIEGAQGLGLDQYHGHFPYVTRSCTGLANMIPFASANAVELMEVIYVTRCYATRHGAGPLEHEGEFLSAKLEDPTNVTNQWQGSLRYAPLDTSILRERIARDWLTYGRNPDFNPEVRCEMSLAITCLDQIEGAIALVRGDRMTWRSTADLILTVCEDVPSANSVYTSYGPTRETLGKWSIPYDITEGVPGIKLNLPTEV